MRLHAEQQGKIRLASLAIALYISSSDGSPLSEEILWSSFQALLRYCRARAARTDAKEEERQVARWLKQNPWNRDYFLYVVTRLREVREGQQEEFAFLRSYAQSSQEVQQEIYTQLIRAVVINAYVSPTTAECRKLYAILRSVLWDNNLLPNVSDRRVV